MWEEMKKDYVDFMMETRALKFGSFTLKSGRQSPFYLDVGAYSTGPNLKKLGKFYAHTIVEKFGKDFDVLFGPAYKGIPVAVATAMELQENFKKSVRYCSNRKEAKTYGYDKGILFGAELQSGDRLVLIEDVITSGCSLDAAVNYIRQKADVEIVGLVVSFDRHEQGTIPGKTALCEISEKYDFPAVSIVTMYDVMRFMDENLTYGKVKELHEYYKKYGVDWQRAKH